MFEPVLKLVDKETSGHLALAELMRIRSFDRWFTFPKMLAEAESSAGRMDDIGLEGAVVEEFPADGETFVGHWQMPYAWDVQDATLTVVEPEGMAGRVLAHYRAVPCCLTMWSGPTPPGGVTAEVVVVEDGSRPEHYRGLDVKGKIVFSSSRTSAAKGRAAKRGAVGILSDWNPHPHDLPDELFWNNAFSDDPGGWGLKKGDSRIFGFAVTPRVGKELRRLLANGQKLVVKAEVLTRLYSGIMPAATGYIAGTGSAGQVLTLGHGFEQGANDNASGCAVMLEALRALSTLIRERKLKPPKRDIRALITWECYATLAYAERYPEQMAHTVAGLCIDHVGMKQEMCRTALGVVMNPHAQANVADAFAVELARRYFSRVAPCYNWMPSPFSLTDNIIVDPTINIPTVSLEPAVKDLYWHTTGDSEETVDVNALKLLSTFAATYLYFLASAGPKEAYWLAKLGTAEAKSALASEAQQLFTRITTTSSARRLGENLEAGRERLAYIRDLKVRAVTSVERYLSGEERNHLQPGLDRMVAEVKEQAGAETRRLEQEARGWSAHLKGKLKKLTPRKSAVQRRAEKLVPVRVDIGPPTLDRVPKPKRGKLQGIRWDGRLHAAFWWCNGKRTLAEVIRLTGQEKGTDCWDLLDEFQELAEHGLIELAKA